MKVYEKYREIWKKIPSHGSTVSSKLSSILLAFKKFKILKILSTRLSIKKNYQDIPEDPAYSS